MITAGTGAGQSRIVSSNTANSLTVTTPWGVTPDATSTYLIQATVAAAGPVIPFAGDFNGDGVTDLAVYSPQGTVSYNPANPTVPITNTSPSWIIENSQGGSPLGGNITATPLGMAGDIPFVGDFDHDGVTDVGVFEPATGKWLIAESSKGLQTFTFGQAGDTPVPANYDGTGVELALYRPGTGQYIIAGPGSSVGAGGAVTGATTFTLGQPNEVPAPAAYDNTFYFTNGVAERTEAAVFNPTTGLLTVLKQTVSGTGQTQTGVGTTYNVQFNPGDIIAPGDYDGTGNEEPAAYRPSTGQFVIVGPNSSVDPGTGAISNPEIQPGIGQKFGQQGDIPVLAPYFFKTQTGTVPLPGALQIVSISPAAPYMANGLPNGQVVVTFNHPIAGLVADDPTGGGFASNPYAVTLGPEGPDGAFAPTSGIDKGSIPVHSTLVYHVNADGTSTITLTPTVPLGTDLYLIRVDGGLTDTSGDPLTNGQGQAGAIFDEILLYPDRPATPNLTSPQVTGVSAYNGTVPINNNLIAQPDTIAIAFSRPMDFLTTNTSTVHLFAKTATGMTALPAGVTYSPTTQSVYLTPESALFPGVTYLIAVDGSVTDDQGFPGTGVPLGTPFYDTFMVTAGPPARPRRTASSRWSRPTRPTGRAWPRPSATARFSSPNP